MEPARLAAARKRARPSGPLARPRATGPVRVSKKTFPDTDTGPFEVSLEVGLARSEAPSSRFDLRRVVRFSYPQCAFQTTHAPQKEVNGAKWCCTKRSETHPLQLGGRAELGRGGGCYKSQFGLPLFLIRVTELKFVEL